MVIDGAAGADKQAAEPGRDTEGIQRQRGAVAHEHAVGEVPARENQLAGARLGVAGIAGAYDRQRPGSKFDQRSNWVYGHGAGDCDVVAVGVEQAAA